MNESKVGAYQDAAKILLEPSTLHPNPATRNPKPEARNPKP
jgi:hypothetical protein